MPSVPSFVAALANEFVVNLYGYPLKDLKVEFDEKDQAHGALKGTLEGLGLHPSHASFASIIAVGGANGCATLERPVTLLLTVPSKELQEEECGLKPNGKIRKWVVALGTNAAQITLNAGFVEDLLRPSLSVDALGSEKGGGVRLSNPRVVDGRACVTVHVWAKWSQCVHIPWPCRKNCDKCKTLVDINETRDVCVSLHGCVDAFSVGPVTVRLCFNAPKQLCAVARISVAGWGEDIGSYCIDLPIQHMATEGVPTKCHCETHS